MQGKQYEELNTTSVMESLPSTNNISKIEPTNSMELTSVSTKGQIVIPERVRKKHGIKPGQRLVLFERENELVLRKEEDVEQELSKWNELSARGIQDIWDNKEDEDVWKHYLQDNKK